VLQARLFGVFQLSLQPAALASRSNGLKQFLWTRNGFRHAVTPTRQGDNPMRDARLLSYTAFFILVFATSFAQSGTNDFTSIAPIKFFIGDGFGVKHASAPAEIDQFGQLVGIWDVEAELRRQDGEWMKSAPGIWAWKYAIDGFAVRDLWYQGADNLPVYMANLGRDYLLTANRIYDVTNKKWQVAWMANGAGKVMGADFGTFTAVFENDEIVMTSPPGDGAFGLQRVVFYEIAEDSFGWKSEYSTDDGKSWNTVMRMRAKRRAHP
jgi:hypothetical protein